MNENTTLPVMLVTNCSASQSVVADAGLRGENLPTGLTIVEAAAEWSNRVSKQTVSITPEQLYKGIAFQSIAKMRSLVSGKNIYITSIGQGFVPLESKIVPYDLSIERSHPNSLYNVVTSGAFSPSAWWTIINQQIRNQSFPIEAAVIAQKKKGCKAVVVACSSKFNQMIAEDLLRASVVLPLYIASTSVSTLPGGIKHLVVLFDERVSVGSIGNRNNKNHRAAHVLLEILKKTPKLMEQEDRTSLSQAVEKRLGEFGEVPLARRRRGKASTEQVDSLRKYLQEHPELANCNPDLERNSVQRAVPLIAGMNTTSFRAVWREVFAKKAKKTNGGADSKKAAAILSEVMGSASIPGTYGNTWSDEEKALEALETFVEALKTHQPDAHFTSTEVVNWAKKYHNAVKEQLPTVLQTPKKVSRLISNYGAQVGIALLPTGQYGKRIYSLAEVEEQTDEQEQA